MKILYGRPVLNNILEAIGNTPLIPIKRLNPNKNVTILAKMESFNPGGSIKDRIALSMVSRAEKRGELTKDKIVIEASSGNTGIGLAMVCAVKGYRCLIAMSEGASIERRKIMQAYGAEILLTPAKLSTDGAIEAIYKLIRDEPDRYFCTDQFNNPDNWLAHYEGTAPEIWRDTNGKVNMIIATMGTTGTLMGITKRIRELGPNVRIIGVEPYLGHKIQGLKNMKESYRPGIFDKTLPDTIVNIHDEEAFEFARRLASEEGLFVGMSSGAAMAAAFSQASSMKEGVIVVIFPDGGERYLSTNLFLPRRKNKGEEQGGPVIKLTNTLTREKERFEPLLAGKVGIYSCGPTVYEYAHLGLCRRMVVADLLKRLLLMQGYDVTHVVNITDIDDKTIKAALKDNMGLDDLTDRYFQAFLEDVSELNILPASFYPKASAHIPEMIDIARRLLDAGYAYVKHGSVYFDISKLPSYGRLSRIDISKIHVGKTVDLDNYDKDSPVDFTLFKRVTLEELKKGIGFETSWGQVRPSWHIECVAMSMKYLGEYFDIHTSGCDLVFPHHENEIAMASALTGKPLAKYWIHSELVHADGKKMSRSLKNIITLRDLKKKGFSGRQIRFFLLKTNYRKPLIFSFKAVREAVQALRRIDRFTAGIKTLIDPSTNIENTADYIKETVKEMENGWSTALNDDLNVSGAIGALARMIRKVNYYQKNHGLTGPDATTIFNALKKLDDVMACLDLSGQEDQQLENIRSLIGLREAARKNKNWAEADRLRDELLKMGVEVMDTCDGVRWLKKE
ncbi:MAG: cysteine--tRNA ligase [Dissulfurimicrobium hydrothermale]|uniref:cysteine--tRNA ligase n=2 Tax=Dissulfurimicrobium TaxID=1769732 RepID=UPI003C762400